MMITLFAAVLRQGLTLLLLAAAPPLVLAALVGAVSDLVLRRLGVNDPAVPSLLRLGAGLAALLVTGPTLAASLSRFTLSVLQLLTAAGRLPG